MGCLQEGELNHFTIIINTHDQGGNEGNNDSSHVIIPSDALFDEEL